VKVYCRTIVSGYENLRELNCSAFSLYIVMLTFTLLKRIYNIYSVLNIIVALFFT